VLPFHSKDMVAALRRAGKTVEWISFPGEGHGLSWTADRKRYYAALLSFLQRYIGDHEAVAPVQAAASDPAQ
jgi:dipeptidyl aminopeptidase/acylaminoacyl peptidase